MNRLDTYRALTRNIEGVNKPLIALGIWKVWNLLLGLFPLFLYSFLVKRVLVDTGSSSAISRLSATLS